MQATLILNASNSEYTRKSQISRLRYLMICPFDIQLEQEVENGYKSQTNI
jgi:hypothetical protein